MVSLAAGVVLYLLASVINLSHYDEGPDNRTPWWLTALVFVAIGLAVFGLASLAWAAVRALRSKSGAKPAP